MRHSPVRKTRKKVVNCRDAREEDQQENEHPMNKQKETKRTRRNGVVHVPVAAEQAASSVVRAFRPIGGP
jgi:protein tyrosine phosphatase (PTP) superfamily phosphohydrolase (DUF442 family)